MALTRSNGRQRELAAGSFCERWERTAVDFGRSRALEDGDEPCDRWVTSPAVVPVIAVITQ